MCVWWRGEREWYNIIKRSHKNNKSSHTHPPGTRVMHVPELYSPCNQSTHCIPRHPFDINVLK